MKKLLIVLLLASVLALSIATAQESIFAEDVTGAVVFSVASGTFVESEGGYLLTLSNMPTVSTLIFKTPEFAALAYPNKDLADDWNFTKMTDSNAVLGVPATLILSDRVVEMTVTNPTYNDMMMNLTLVAEVNEVYWLAQDEKDDPTAPEAFGAGSIVFDFDNAALNALFNGQAVRLRSTRDVTAQSTCPPSSYCKGPGKNDSRCIGC